MRVLRAASPTTLFNPIGCPTNGVHLNVNGYRDGPGSKNGTARIDDSPVQSPTLEQNKESVDVAAEPAAEVTSQAKPARKAAGKEKPSPEKPKGRAGRTTGTTKAGKKVKSAGPRIKYVPQAELDAELASLEKLSVAALAGDSKALDKLRSELDECPHVWQCLGDLQQRVDRKMSELVAGKDVLRSEAFRKRCSEIRHQLVGGESASLLTKMAASRVVSCWLFAQLLELRLLELFDKRWSMKELAAGERRFQTAMRTFGMARQLDKQLQRPAK